MLETIAPVALLAALLALFGVVLRHSFLRSRKMVEQWARDHGLVLSRCEWHCSGDSPFSRRGGWEVIWTVRIADAEGRTRDAWARCGSPLIGMLSDHVEVRWR